MEQTPIGVATPVVVIGFDMPFWPLVRFLIKLALASIPAGIVIGIVYVLMATLTATSMFAVRQLFSH